MPLIKQIHWCVSGALNKRRTSTAAHKSMMKAAVFNLVNFSCYGMVLNKGPEVFTTGWPGSYFKIG